MAEEDAKSSMAEEDAKYRKVGSERPGNNYYFPMARYRYCPRILRAWIAVDDARQEVQFLRAHPPARPHMHTLAPARATLRSLCLQADADEYSELRDALRRARAAFDSYLALAPAEQVSAAREAEGREGGSR